MFAFEKHFNLPKFFLSHSATVSFELIAEHVYFYQTIFNQQIARQDSGLWVHRHWVQSFIFQQSGSFISYANARNTAINLRFLFSFLTATNNVNARKFIFISCTWGKNEFFILIKVTSKFATCKVFSFPARISFHILKKMVKCEISFQLWNRFERNSQPTLFASFHFK